MNRVEIYGDCKNRGIKYIIKESSIHVKNGKNAFNKKAWDVNMKNLGNTA